MKVNERSSKTVTSTGVMVPLPDWVWALKALQNSMMLMLAPPSAPAPGVPAMPGRRGSGA